MTEPTVRETTHFQWAFVALVVVVWTFLALGCAPARDCYLPEQVDQGVASGGDVECSR